VAQALACARRAKRKGHSDVSTLAKGQRNSEMKNIAILGCTGSIGRQTIAVVEALPEQFRIVALAAGSNLKELLPQIERHTPEIV
jgi:hypothetical protein